MVEVLEPRVLYSADSVASLMPLLLPDELDTAETLGSSLLFDAHSDISENDLLPEKGADTSAVNHVVFIDSTVAELDTLRESAASESTTVVIINAGENGVSVISETLEKYSSLNSVQVISHGASGQLFLGNQNLDEQQLIAEQSAISRWSNALSDDGDILLLGCDVGAGEGGNSFVQKLALLTGADVAASNDLTGHEKFAADWDLEVSTGAIDAVMQLDSNTQSSWAHTLGTIDVDTVVDKFDPVIQDSWGVGNLISHRSGTPGFEISLREAIYVSQNLPDLDTINLPSGNFALTLTSGLVDGKWGDLNLSQDTIIVGDDNPNTPTVISQDVVNNRVVSATAGNLQIENVTIQNAASSPAGGAIYSAGSVVLTDSLLINNSSTGNGGAIATEGNLTLLRSHVSGNSSGQFGGALYSEGIVTIDESTFTGNSSLDDGGAVYASSDALTIRDSSFSGNFTDSADASGMTGNGGAVAATSDTDIIRSSFDNNETRNQNLHSKGGAVFHEGSGSIGIRDTTFSNNTSVSGGAVYTDQEGGVSSSTFVDNTAVLNGSAVQSDGPNVVSIGGSIFSGNDFTVPGVVSPNYTIPATQTAVDGNLQSNGFNLLDFDPSSQMALSVGDIVNTASGAVASQLSPLSQIDGSFVKVHALNEGSQAINAGSVSLPGAQDAQGNSRDQVADIGASEYDSAASIVYWADAAGGIFRSDVDFSNVQQIVFGATNPDSIVVDETTSTLYWLTNGDGNVSGSADLMSASLDGIGGEVTVLANLLAVSSVAINPSAGHLYVAYSGNTQLNPSRIDQYDLQNLAAAPVTIVVNGGAYTTSVDSNEIIIDPTEMVFNATSGQLMWSELGGGSVAPSIRIFDAAENTIDSMVVNPVTSSVTVNPEATSVFWTNSLENSILEFDLDSSTLTQTAVPVADLNPAGIDYAKTEDLLVWISDSASSISSINADDKTPHSRYEHGSVLSDVVTMRTTTVTDVPTITTNSDMSVPEGAGRLIPKTNLIATDADSDVGDIQYSVIQAPVNGYLTLSVGGTAQPTTTFSQQDLNQDLVRYVHDGTETLSDQIELQVSDGIHSSDRFKYDIQITPVNDAPTLNVATDAFGALIKMPIQEAGIHVLDPAVLVGFDEETASDVLEYHLVSTVSAGVFSVDGNTEATLFTGAQLVAGLVQFEHDGSENAPASLDFKLVDGSSSDSESGTVTMNFDYTPINDAPVLTTEGVTVFENQKILIDNDNLLVTDPDSSIGTIVYSLVTIPTHGVVEVDGRGPLTESNATFTQDELNADSVFYTPTVNNPGNAQYELVFVATDVDGGSSEPASMSVLVTGINNAPVLSTLPIDGVLEGGEVILSASNIIVLDPDSPDTADWELSFRNTEEMNGTVSVYSPFGDVDDDGYRYVPYADLVNGNIIYKHDGGETTSAVIKFRVSDGVSTTEEVDLVINIEPVNDTPSLRVSNNSITVDEGDQYVFETSDFSFTDADAVQADMQLFFGVTEDTIGAITVDGVDKNSFTLAELADGLVVYTHDGSEPSVTGASESFALRLSDGEKLSDSVVLTIGIESKNDLPEFTFEPSAETFDENVSGQVIGEIHYTDADIGDTVEFSVSDSRFVLTPIAGENTVRVVLAENEAFDFEQDTVSDSSSMTFEILAKDTNPDVERSAEYQGVRLEVELPIVDVNEAPVINTDPNLLVPIPTEAPFGDQYSIQPEWFIDSEHELAELRFSATLEGGVELPYWLNFDSSSKMFSLVEDLTEAQLLDLRDIVVEINVEDPEGAIGILTLPLKFALPEPDIGEVNPIEELEEEVVEEPVIISVPDEFPDVVPPEVDIGDIAAALPTEEPEASGEVKDKSEEQQTKTSADGDLLDDELNEKVDLHDLIKPLASIGNLQLAVVDTAIGSQSGDSSAGQLNQDMDMRDLTDIFKAGQSQSDAQAALMANAMDNTDILRDERSAASRALFGTSTGLSTGLSVGYLLWLVRGGTLMGSVLSSMPAWRFVDPLPVLGSLTDDMDNDEESLESIVENKGN